MALKTEGNKVKVKDDLQILHIEDQKNHLGLTEDVELHNLLGVEGAHADGADVGAVVSDLQSVQGQGGVALGHQARGVHAGEGSTCTCWRRGGASGKEDCSDFNVLLFNLVKIVCFIQNIAEDHLLIFSFFFFIQDCTHLICLISFLIFFHVFLLLRLHAVSVGNLSSPTTHIYCFFDTYFQTCSFLETCTLYVWCPALTHCTPLSVIKPGLHF